MQNFRPAQYASQDREDQKSRDIEDLMREVKTLRDEVQRNKKFEETAPQQNSAAEDKRASQLLQKSEQITKEQEAKIEALTSIVHNKDKELEELKRTMARVEEEIKKSSQLQAQAQQQLLLQQQQLVSVVAGNNSNNQQTAAKPSVGNNPFGAANTKQEVNPVQPAAKGAPAKQEDAGSKNKVQPQSETVQVKPNLGGAGGGATPKEEIKKPSGLNFPPLKGDPPAVQSMLAI